MDREKRKEGRKEGGMIGEKERKRYLATLLLVVISWLPIVLLFLGGLSYL